jgi:hypothetical protein
MAAIHDDLNIGREPCSAPASALISRAAINASYSTLTARFGDPDFARSAGPGQDSTIWILDTPVGRAHLHNWLSRSHFLLRPETSIRWTIQCANDDPLPWIFKAVTGATDGFPDSVAGATRTSTRATLLSAYADYLYLRAQAVDDWLAPQHPSFTTFREHWWLPRHLRSMALQVRQILVRHDWAQASNAEREAWIRAPRPIADGSDLHSWHQATRWQCVPGQPDATTECRSLTLAERVVDCADDEERFRDQVLRAQAPSGNRTRKIAVHDEHIATLVALASPSLTDVAGGRR